MTRIEEIEVGSYVHVCNRGVRKMSIYRHERDLWRMRAGLFYFNSAHLPENWARDIPNLTDLSWPVSWNKREPLVAILGFAIMQNHFHLILKEIKKGGVSSFMHKFTMGYSKYINAKYNESGSLFQGKFKAKIVGDDAYLRHLAVYVLVKNPFEAYPLGRISGAAYQFDKAYEWAIRYPFCSLAEYVGQRRSPIIEGDVFGELFSSHDEFREFAKDYIENQPDDMLL
jgi:hypothetical protein